MIFTRIAKFEDLKPNMPYQDKAERRPDHIRKVADVIDESESYQKIMRSKCKRGDILIK